MFTPLGPLSRHTIRRPPAIPLCISSSSLDDALVTVRPVLDRIPHLKELLQVETEDDFSDLRRAEATGRPLGAPKFVTGLENLLGRKIARRAPGRKPATEADVAEQLELL
jgi:hypothetical protein